ncbi:metal-sensitive transcriptional regulator [Bifidobacterium sp.]|uniref:metal-sensitive transcriptional regulator n=1 Tax=Bifidobacterium sp. TaxID=41200 RepID=UPI0025B80579|nr:metal-sensitive transcriptional regulator [Bifidobacterium sp.]MCH4160682.1 metal-sensitive transcriptional regulator [Bifidobacterium sp.]MCH4174879.1 metal-sensitive transcriptional regulator [Bifidobacterium sp.]MCI1634961.1 metal-sensitive transcriptional regulator [Bifidobacterium sp.]
MIHREESGKSHGYVADKQRVAARLKRVEGQVRAITRMVEDDTYCIDVLTQISACDKALKSVALLLLNDHLNHCVRTAVSQGGDIADDKLKEAEDAIARLVRS